MPAGRKLYSGGGFPSVVRLRLMKDLKATILTATPTYAMHGGNGTFAFSKRGITLLYI